MQWMAPGQKDARRGQSAAIESRDHAWRRAFTPRALPKRPKSQAFGERAQSGRGRPIRSGTHCARPARLYALQLNVYRSILEDEYNYRVSLMLLGQVHPELAGPKIIFVPRMEEELQLVVEDQIARRLAWPEPRPGETAEFALPVGNGATSATNPQGVAHVVSKARLAPSDLSAQDALPPFGRAGPGRFGRAPCHTTTPPRPPRCNSLASTGCIQAAS